MAGPDHQALRSELLERASSEFAARGFGRVSMRSLATSLGVTTGTLYHYFPGKQELFEQMAESIAARSARELIGKLPRGGTSAERARLAGACARGG
jgi:AcrR family transcriptional regulator